MLHLASVSERIASIQAEIVSTDAKALELATERLGLSKEWVLERLVELVERPGERKYDAPVAQRAIELIGKHLSMFTSGDGPTVNVNVGLQFIDRPPAETHEEWEARRKLELAPKPKLINGNGKAHS
jgi:DNA-binding Lrp family transcriptional regulator